MKTSLASPYVDRPAFTADTTPPATSCVFGFREAARPDGDVRRRREGELARHADGAAPEVSTAPARHHLDIGRVVGVDGHGACRLVGRGRSLAALRRLLGFTFGLHLRRSLRAAL